MWWFKKKRWLPEKVFMDWSFSAWEWLLENNGGISAFQSNQLIVDDIQFFPYQHQSTEDWAFKTFNLIKLYMGMEGWHCYLEQEDTPMQDFFNQGIIGELNEPAGTFSLNTDGPTITFSKNTLDNEYKFISTMAHELSHFLLENVYHTPPGGNKLEEYATDLCVVFKGFGVHQIKAFYTISSNSYSFQGYFNERQTAFNLAIFLLLKRIEVTTLKATLNKPHYRLVNDSHEEILDKYSDNLSWISSVESRI